MDYYAQCLKQVLLSELSRLETKEKMYKEIYDKAFDEYMLKEEEIKDMIDLIECDKRNKKIKLLIKLIILGLTSIFVYSLVLIFGKIGLSLLGTSNVIYSLFASFVSLGFAPVLYKIFNKEIYKMIYNESDYDKQLEMLRCELEEKKKEMEKTQTEYLNVCFQVSELQEEIDDLEYLNVHCDIEGDKEVITVAKKPFTKKLKRK